LGERKLQGRHRGKSFEQNSNSIEERNIVAGALEEECKANVAALTMVLKGRLLTALSTRAA